MSNVTSENCLLVAHQARRQLNKEQNVRGVSFDVQAGLVILEISFKHTCTKKIFMHTAAKKISHLFSVEKKHNNWYSADTWSMAWLPLSWRSINCWLIVGGVEWLCIDLHLIECPQKLVNWGVNQGYWSRLSISTWPWKPYVHMIPSTFQFSHIWRVWYVLP